jgi:hypothetical protein
LDFFLKELQQALMNGNMSHFSEEACRMMIGTVDHFCRILMQNLLFLSVFRIRSQFFGIPDPLVRGADPDSDLDPSIFKPK